MQIDHLEPARSIIAKFGGPDAVARITKRDVSRVYRWMYPRDRGGTDGSIPHAEARKLLDHAVENGIALEASEFFERSPAPAEAAA